MSLLIEVLGNIIRLPDFTELFVLDKIFGSPQFLFACQRHCELLLLSSPQLQNPEKYSSIVVAANLLTKFCFGYDSSEICGPVRGLICRTDVKGRKGTLPVICNPSMGETLKLPKLKMRIDGLRSFFGYDPIGKQFTLLSMTWSYEKDEFSMENQVLTLGNKKLSWRKVECSMPHRPGPNGICINGSLYYVAGVCKIKESMILCFDIRSEKFRFIDRAEEMALWRDSTLVNYNGKLAALVHDVNGFTGKSRFIQLWSLEDPEKHEWSKHVHVLPPLWKKVVGQNMLYISGMIGMNQIVLSPRYLYNSDPFYVYYLNIEKITIVRVGVQGLEAFRYSRLHTFLNHVENLELMQAI